MTYTQAVEYLLSLVNIPRREYLKDSKHCDIYLKRLQVLLDIFGNPEKKIPHYIHVTGTSGKGSVCLMLSSILKQAGKKVGTITSPHPSNITERWEINGKPIAKKKFVRLIEFLKPKLDIYLQTSIYDVPSFFEIITALGLLHFAQEKIDWAVIEVGLGGRYDSTNIIPYKDIAAITNIGTDHKKIIGPTKKDIAYEKAGIIKKGATVFTTETSKPMIDIFNKEIALSGAGQLNIISVKNIKTFIKHSNGISFDYQKDRYQLPFFGKHQIINSLLAIEIAKKISIRTVNIIDGLKKVKLPLRFELVKTNPNIIVDGAHNLEKMKTTVHSIKEKYKNKEINLVIGFSEDKEWQKMIKLLSTLNLKKIICTRFTNNTFRQTANPKDIANQFTKILPTSKVIIFTDPLKAWKYIKNKKNPILITGSFFLAGQFRQYI